MPPLPPPLTPGHPLFGLGYSNTHREYPFVRLAGEAVTTSSADVAEEVPVAFVYNGRPHVVMMATPSDFEDFGAGFSLSEEIVGSLSELERIEVVPYSQGVELQLQIPAERAAAVAGRDRQLAGRTGCGLCGVQTITDALRPTRTVTHEWVLKPSALWRAESLLAARQELNRTTKAVHAAAWATRDGELQVVREDVGRHNALDKVIGALARDGRDPSSGFVVMTSRASYELVQKAAAAGIPLLAAVSRPTGLAVRLAEAAGMTLVALLRGESGNVYAHAERISERTAEG
jgi:formate dehydrogenase accessory protein FdhD